MMFCHTSWCSDTSSTRHPKKSSSDLSSKKQKNHQHHSISDDFIADALKQMSLEERDNLYHEIHGVAGVVDETPDFVEQSLHELQNELVKQLNCPKSKSFFPISVKAFQMAQSMSPDFVNNPKFRLRFVRAERFDAPKAAVRMLRYFEMKRKLFGESKLCKEITFEDLDEDDVEGLMKGHLQIGAERDRSGRAILFGFPSHQQDFKSPESFGRIFFYLDVRDEETQKKGMVSVIHPLEDALTNLPSVDTKFIAMGHMLNEAKPNRTASSHHCFGDISHGFHVVLDFLMKLADKDTRGRVKIHDGSRIENIYSLMTYGIPDQAVPLSKDGEIKLKSHIEWIKMQKKREEYAREGVVAEMIELPSHTDFLIGRGKPTQGHICNMRLHAIIDDSLPRYEEASKREKTVIAGDIVAMIKAGGSGRFLSQETGVWMEVPDDVARGKVSQLFRSRRKLKAHNATSSAAAEEASAYARTKGTYVERTAVNSKVLKKAKLF